MAEHSRPEFVERSLMGPSGIMTVEVVGREAREMATALSERHGIDCRPMSGHGLNGLRISLSVFKGEDQAELLLRGMREAA